MPATCTRLPALCTRHPGLLIVLAMLCPGAAAADPPPLDLGLIIGNNHRVGDAARNLRFADDDALEAAENFRAFHPDGQLWLLTDPDAETLAQNGALALDYAPPTLDSWLQVLEHMRRAVDEAHADHRQVTLLVHFSGHGEPDASLHFADGLLPARAFRGGLALVGADRTFALMDGCYLGGVARGDGTPAPVTSIFRPIELEAEERPPGFGLIGATSLVLEQDYLARGVMTLVGLSGLAGPADLNDDGRITFRELGRYMSNQLGHVPGGPEVVVVAPRRDGRVPVVELERSGLGGIRLGERFPAGQIRVVRRDTQEVVAELYHHGDRQVSLYLVPGDYQVVRLLERDSWEYPGYPAWRTEVHIRRQVVGLDHTATGQTIVLLPPGLRSVASLPANVVPVPITAQQERSLLNSPFRKRSASLSRRSTVSYVMRIGDPWLGLDLARSDLAAPRAWRPAGAVRTGRTWPLLRRGRWFLGTGFTLQYGLQLQKDLWAGQTYYPTALRHELRAGPVLQQTWAGRMVRMSLDQSVAYAPSAVTAGFGLLQDDSAPDRLQRFLFLKNGVVELGLSVRRPFGRRLEIGPRVSGELLRVALPSVDGSAPIGWEGQVSVGLELRESAWSEEK